MHMLMIWVEGIGQPFGLRFKDGARAEQIAEVVRVSDRGTACDVTDDYEQKVSVPRASIKVVHIVCIERDMEAQGDMAILKAIEDLKTQTRAQADKVLQLHNGVASGGRLITPPGH